jgi:phage FluMu protein Com
MTIEFRCTSCNKLLRTSDERAGARAKCPDCGTAITVPRPGGAATGGDFELDAYAYDDDDARDAERYGAEFAPQPRSRHDQSGYAADTKNCPMCGAEIKAAAVKCRFCGEMLGDRPGVAAKGTGHPTKIDAGEVISTSWAIFKSEMGLLIGAFIVFGLMMFVIGLIMQFVQGGLMAAFGGGRPGGFPMGPRRGFRQPANPAVVILISLVSLILNLVMSSFPQAGWSLFFLKVAKGTNPEISNLFGGGPYYLRVLGNSILFVLMLYIGSLMCIIPGIIVALMFWPFQYVVVDDRSPQQFALSRAKELTDGNWGAVILLFLAAIGFNILGMLACCIGLLFTAPLTTLMFAVAYCRMAGYRTALER